MSPLHAAFALFDTDGDGYLSAHEVLELLQRRTPNAMTLEQAREFLRHVSRPAIFVPNHVS